MMKKLVLLQLIILALSMVAVGQDDKQSALAVVDRLFDGMKAKDAEQIRSVFAAEAQLVAIDKPRDGKGPSTTRIFTGDEFAKMIGGAKGGDFIEKMHSPTVWNSGDLAIVTGRYTFHVGDKFSHCGTNTFNIVRTDSGWKIANGASTLEFQCDQDLKAVDVPVIAADPKDVATLDGIIKAFYETITGPKGAPRQWGRDRTLYMPDVRFVSMGEKEGKILSWTSDHQRYVNAANESFVSNGFTEHEIARTVKRFGNIAHVFSTYQYSNDAGTDKGRGVNSIELFWDGTRWWIAYASWDEERPGNPIPREFLLKGGN
jgi:hypothetical protein